jgi:hypothetical protein
MPANAPILPFLFPVVAWLLVVSPNIAWPNGFEPPPFRGGLLENSNQRASARRTSDSPSMSVDMIMNPKPSQSASSRKKTLNLSRPRIPPSPPSHSGYTRSVKKMIRTYNKKGRATGDIKLYAKENHWGPGVKIQSCYGDNILTRFTVIKKGDTDRIWFQFKNVTNRSRKRHRHKWVMVEPGILIRGRYIYLRAQSSRGNGVISIKVVGNCIE